nr:immunoglobulin light chain junction region [Macaca mulatta]MOW04008.1 immunoglobulin light chain junction region [Macaca mulatta]MOW04041.1 immunoglobulin light chain junction region [Macaca mulatta]MOW04069.1 immunoglobulin light chain junction region [Macaca mulatta]MOW04088.1 immunoglobulin light chain junction region [Macaca mulatta]
DYYCWLHYSGNWVF